MSILRDEWVRKQFKQKYTGTRLDDDQRFKTMTTSSTAYWNLGTQRTKEETYAAATSRIRERLANSLSAGYLDKLDGIINQIRLLDGNLHAVTDSSLSSFVPKININFSDSIPVCLSLHHHRVPLTI